MIESDPLAVLIKFFRTGPPIVLLFREVARVLEVDGLDFEMMLGMAKEANYSFIPSCAGNLGFDPNEAFHGTELAGDNTNGHVKVRSPFQSFPA
jgi:hypothetical protein